MGNCASIVNCTLTSQPVESDPDVAGIGVLIAFSATVIATFITIVVGYVTDSLPNSTLTGLDRACGYLIPMAMDLLHASASDREATDTQLYRIEGASLIFVCEVIAKIQVRPRESESSFNTLLRRSMSTITAFILPDSPISDRKLEPEERRKRERARRSKGLERFLLALSDQQLVTGLAVLIAGYTNRCSRSLYHFDIIAALGWFSSTTHLSTLAVLRAYMVDHPQVRNWRAIAMLGVFSLLAISQIGTYSTQSNYLPVQCAFESFAPYGLGFLNIIELTIVIIFLALSYTDRIRRLYTFDPDWSILNYLLEVLARRLIKNNDVRNLECMVIASSAQSKAEQGLTYRRLQQRRRWWKFCRTWAKKRPGLGRRVAEIAYLIQEMQKSFLSEILTLLFGVSYGIAQVITNRNNTPRAGISGDQNAMTFGQLVPLLLIALPVLAAGEVYSERHDEAGSASSPMNTFVVLLDPATLLIQDDTDHAVKVTLQMMEDSKASFSRSAVAPSGQVLNHQSAVPFPDANLDIELAEIRSATGEERQDATRAVTGRRREELTTTGSATVGAATTEEDDQITRNADVERGTHEMPKATKLNKVRILYIVFSLQALFNVFFAATLAGAGAEYLYGIPAILSVIGSVLAVISFLANFGLQVKEGMEPEGP